MGDYFHTVRVKHPSTIGDIDVLLLRFGEGLYGSLLDLVKIQSPVTRSALVVFEDSLQDDLTLAEVIEHMRQLRETLGDMIPLKVSDALAEMMSQLVSMPGGQDAAMFRSGFFEHLRVVPI